jgi:hypothetical protein
MTYMERTSAYFEKIAEIWSRLSEEEQQRFQTWKDSHPGACNSEWPGWRSYLGPLPRRAELRVLRRRSA